jgi:hypothetical protein
VSFFNKILLVSFLISFEAYATVDDYLIRYSSPSFSNYGTIGAIQNPTARVLPEGSISFAWSQLDPY